MIDALHLFWIIPLTSAVSFIVCAIFISGGRADLEMENQRLREENNKLNSNTGEQS
jgi:hypothetical protein